ncbi:unnamed protein product [Symbiodinium sp. CCMP2456]|nr:unnamed protein product [Symbiodinium sp. CCMP2456]
MHPARKSGSNPKALEVYTRAGGFKSGSALDGNFGNLLTRDPAHWTCPSIADMAHGTCSEDFGGWGDRFVQLGDWRLAAIDEDNFAFAHKNGENAEVFKSDGNRVTGPFSDRVWRRPLGFPHGITFGQNFIQIGSFRLAALDDNHMSISHQNGQTPKIWKHDATTVTGPQTHWNAWKGNKAVTAGPPAGVGYGNRYLQLGKFRIGVADDSGVWLFVTHTDDGDGKTVEAWKSDGTVHAGRRRRDWSPALNRRNTQWHCGNIQENLGSCSGITAGPGFIQFGDWRLAAISSEYFSISHRSGQTAMRFKSDGTYSAGPRQDHNGWDDRESGYVPAGDLQEVKIGDRFIQFGKFWRLGEVSEDKLSISHKSGQTPLVFQKDGTLLEGPSRSNNLFNRRYAGEPKGVTFGDRFVQIGVFRLGDVNRDTFSIAHVNAATLNERFTKDGHHQRSNGNGDMTTLGRPLQYCKVITDKPRLFSFDTLYTFYNPQHGRYLSLNGHADILSVEANGPEDLPLWRTNERFAVVDAGNGLVALHNARWNRFMKMSQSQMMASPVKAASRLPASGWHSEYFQIVDAGDGTVGLHNPHQNRFVQMRPDGTVQATDERNWDQLRRHTWSYERFYMVPVTNYLQPGTWVSLWNPTAKRFLQMDSGTRMEGGPANMAANALSDGHQWGSWERFRVVDAGEGRVALHSYKHNKYVRMIWNGHEHRMTVSSSSPTTSVELPNGWAGEMGFVPVPLNPDNNEIALWHPGHRRAIKMSGQTVSASADCSAQDLNRGWTGETFRVMPLPDPRLR